jgi:hypothetical protein
MKASSALRKHADAGDCWNAFRSGDWTHCVANMYFLPLAWLEARTGSLPADFDASAITLAGRITPGGSTMRTFDAEETT